jgi:hypothetical protein
MKGPLIGDELWGIVESLLPRKLDKLGRLGLIDWSRASLDSASVPAKKGREDRPQPCRSRPPRLQVLLVDRSEMPLAVVLTGAQVYDSEVFEEVADDVEPVKEPRGDPGSTPTRSTRTRHATFRASRGSSVCAA